MTYESGSWSAVRHRLQRNSLVLTAISFVLTSNQLLAGQDSLWPVLGSLFIRFLDFLAISNVSRNGSSVLYEQSENNIHGEGIRRHTSSASVIEIGVATHRRLVNTAGDPVYNVYHLDPGHLFG